MNLTIDKNIPLPARRISRWAALEVGDSRLVAKNSERVNAITWARKNGRKFTTETKPGGYRVWRVE